MNRASKCMHSLNKYVVINTGLNALYIISMISFLRDAEAVNSTIVSCSFPEVRSHLLLPKQITFTPKNDHTHIFWRWELIDTCRLMLKTCMSILFRWRNDVWRVTRIGWERKTERQEKKKSLFLLINKSISTKQNRSTEGCSKFKVRKLNKFRRDWSQRPKQKYILMYIRVCRVLQYIGEINWCTVIDLLYKKEHTYWKENMMYFYHNKKTDCT